MKPWTSCLASIGLAGSCLLWAGCGGGDVPDTSSASDASAAGGAPAATPVDDTAAPAPVAVSAPQPGPGAPAIVATKGEDAAPAAAAAPEAKSETASATTEMLALANAPTTGGEKAEGGEAAAAAPGQVGSGGMNIGSPPGGMNIGTPPGGAGGMPGYPGAAAGGPNMAAGFPGTGGAGAPAGYPGAAGGPGAAGAYPGMQAPGMAGGGRLGSVGAAGDGFGGPPGMSGPGGGPGASGPADYTTPQKAVQTFLAAVASKDADRLADAIALHAGTPQPGQQAETSVNYQKYFDMIRDGSISAEDLDFIAKKFEGMTYHGQNQAKSSGRLGIIVGKSGTKGDTLTRTVTVRKEKAGWKVVDVSGQHDMPGMIRGTTGGGRRR